MSKHNLCCSHCGKLILYGTNVLDFEGLIYCSKDCIDEEVDDNCYYRYYKYLSDEEINKIIKESGSIKSFNWSITDY